VLVTHRTTVLAVTSKLLLLLDGVVQAFGPRDEVLQAIATAQLQSRQAANENAAHPKPKRIPKASPDASTVKEPT
jgi:ATP-binding cassette subfamily C exporter for protease/lipase